MELDYEIVEWVNGMNENALEADDDQGARDDDDRRRYVPAMERFALFLKQADKYPALEFGDVVNNTCLSSGASAAASRKVIVVEDLPYLSTSAMRLEFQRLLRQHLDSARTSYPLVLVMSDFSDDHSVDANDARFLQQSFDTGRRAGSATGGDAMHLYSILPPDILRHHYCKKIT